MAIALKRLTVRGPGVVAAEVGFDRLRNLVRGPSDTGKSHIFDCIWYLLGGSAAPEHLPESAGYDSMELVFTHGEYEYLVRKAIAGGAAAIFVRLDPVHAADGAPNRLEPVDQDLGELLVKLSGAGGKQMLRSRSERGPVTGDDLRHWALLSQPDMIAKEATSGTGPAAPKRVSSFSLFLTGLDDSAIELYKTNSEKDQAAGKLALAEAELARTQAGIPADVDRESTVVALERVDESLGMLTTQLQVRSSLLRDLRLQISVEGEALGGAATRLASAKSIHERFTLLDQKYSNDLARLGATDEGIAFFEALSETPCPLCGTPIEQQIDPGDLKPRAPMKYRDAVAAEAEKIRELRRGLQQSLAHEQVRIEGATAEVRQLTWSLKNLEEHETQILRTAAVEFDADPRQLAEEHTRLSSLLGAFDEATRLKQEIARLEQEKKQKRTALVRNSGTHDTEVGKLAREMLVDWGFTTIGSVYVDAAVCDLVVDGRRRLSYGAGKRGLFRTALTIALMRYALTQGHPHLGAVVLDSPLKAYAQKESPDDTDRDIPTATVNESFYRWLSRWDGPGQIIVLENEVVDPVIARMLKAIEFTDSHTHGRQGFYPPRPSLLTLQPPALPAQASDTDGTDELLD
ncbi:hypothetical protein [Tahibacter harae]|uniref:AAA domain-containing protein n=1 Tax=Tahibacter harae TaxID=2963937 RepID=A0ABT1QMV5_9GAMM|nr:hypothetical protein [Tahibacter harae]MCQ4163853.1 hypothetical protein [Tahibacter harae]